MPFTPKAAWTNITILYEGEKSHHFTPKVIQMRPPSGKLEENDNENASVFVPHFEKLLNAVK